MLISRFDFLSKVCIETRRIAIFADVNDPSRRLSPEELDEQLVSDFFDLELEMEKSYCRDLVSTMPQYENG